MVLCEGWLAGEDEVAAGILDGGQTTGLAGKQIVTEKDRPEVSEGRRRAGLSILVVANKLVREEPVARDDAVIPPVSGGFALLCRPEQTDDHAR